MNVTGDTGDEDDDGIPVDATYNADCTWEYNGVSIAWTFRNVNVKDPDDEDPKAGVQVSTPSTSEEGKVEWRVQAENLEVVLTWTGINHSLVAQDQNSYEFTYQGKWELVVNGQKYGFRYNLVGTWDPDDASRPWVAGTINTSESSFEGSGPECSNGWNLTVTLDSVHYDGTKIVGGTANFSVTDCNGGSCKVTVTWNSDGTPSVEEDCR